MKRLFSCINSYLHHNIFKLLFEAEYQKQNHAIMNILRLSILSAFIIFSITGNAQKELALDNQVNLLFGLTQIALDGFNVEANLAYNRIIIDYSHGISLNTNNEFLEDGPDKAQGLAIHIPWTTGIGIGYRFNNWLNLRVEPKWHKFELFYDGDIQNVSNLVSDYTTFTLGLGLYTNFRPFKNKNNFLKGIMIAPNVRYWPRLSSSLIDNTLEYSNRITNQNETHTAREIGIGNTPFFFNMSIGYSYTF